MRLSATIAGWVLGVSALYLTAALAIGPDDTNAQLCAIIDHLWAGSGVPCTTIFGGYALTIAAIVAGVCAIALIIDGAIWGLRLRRNHEKKKTKLIVMCGFWTPCGARSWVNGKFPRELVIFLDLVPTKCKDLWS